MPTGRNAIPTLILTVALGAFPAPLSLGTRPSARAGVTDAAAAPLILAAPASRPTLATEDTLHMDLPPVLVHAPRVTLNEILKRVAQGEARRESLLTDQTFVVTTRMVRNPATPADTAALVRETVMRVYRKKPHKVRTEQLRHWEAKASERKKRYGMQITFGAGMGERIVNYAFRPEAWRDYKYTIAGRDLVGDHVIYRITFTPRSLLSSDPSGQVWVDTNEFVILRQDAHFAHSPMPLMFKGINRIVVERQRIGDFWVLRRVLVRIETTFKFPQLGNSFDLSLIFDQYAINRGLDDRLFTGAQKKEDDE
jgi:hypothetical protein